MPVPAPLDPPQVVLRTGAGGPVAATPRRPLRDLLDEPPQT